MQKPDSSPEGPSSDGNIELRLHDLEQMFNSMDASPFHEKDLDADAEEFIVSWAKELPAHRPISLVVYLEQAPGGIDPRETLRKAIHHYFRYRSELCRRELRQLLAQGRMSLVIGLAFLSLCVTASELVARLGDAPIYDVAREGLVIGGWVAMWRPMQIFLYDWWPLRRLRRLYDRLATMQIAVQTLGLDKAGVQE